MQNTIAEEDDQYGYQQNLKNNKERTLEEINNRKWETISTN